MMEWPFDKKRSNHHDYRWCACDAIDSNRQTLTRRPKENEWEGRRFGAHGSYYVRTGFMDLLSPWSPFVIAAVGMGTRVWISHYGVENSLGIRIRTRISPAPVWRLSPAPFWTVLSGCVSHGTMRALVTHKRYNGRGASGAPVTNSGCVESGVLYFIRET